MSAQREMRSAFDRDHRVTPKARDNLDVWAERSGWCSACNCDEASVTIVQIGVRDVATVGMCERCVDRMAAALETMRASLRQGKENG